MGPEGAKAVATALPQSQVTSLSLRLNGFLTELADFEPRLHLMRESVEVRRCQLNCRSIFLHQLILLNKMPYPGNVFFLCGSQHWYRGLLNSCIDVTFKGAKFVHIEDNNCQCHTRSYGSCASF